MKGLYGNITVPSKPQRVVVLRGFSDFGIVDAAGVKPVAVQWWGGDKTAKAIFEKSSPWLEGRLDLETVRTDLLDGNGNGKAVPEAILAQKPDLIIADGWSVPDKVMFDQLSKIAPTWVPPKEFTTWEERVIAVAKLTDQESEARKTIESVEAKLADARAELGGLKGKTWQMAYTDKDSNLGLYAKYDAVAWAGLGLEPGDGVPEGDFKTVSRENLDQMNADVLVLAYEETNEKQVRAWADVPQFKNLPSVRNNAVFIVPWRELQSLRFLPASTDWMLDNWVPKLKKTSYITRDQ